MNNSKSTIIGFSLLLLLWFLYVWLNAPSQERVKWEQEQKRIQDSIKLVEFKSDSLSKAQENVLSDSLKNLQAAILADSTRSQEERDSLLNAINAQASPSVLKAGEFANFATAAACEEKTYTLENDQLLITFSSKGGRIIDVKVKNYLGYDHTTADPNDKVDLHILNHKNDIFNYFIPLPGAKRGGVNTQDLCFEPKLEGKTIIFRAYTDSREEYIEQKYVLNDSEFGYLLDYDLKLQGIANLMPNEADNIQLHWYTHLPRLEKNPDYERNNSTIHFKEVDGSATYCTCAGNAEKKLDKNIHWVSHFQQFFNASLIFKGDKKPARANFQTFMMPKDSAHLKDLYSKIDLPLSDASAEYNMQFYLGPNKYENLIAQGVGLEKIIPFGWSIFGVIGRYIIRPIFNFFASFIGNYGIIIILLTLLIRVLMFPLQFKMLKSGVKMSILRPQLEELKKKYKDDSQGYQMEQMRVYNEYGVSPLGGCVPMLLTMPIWISLYRFFPASIEFRQKGFLWADDLVSYDSILDFGYIPIIGDFYGDHISLFTLLWTISMFAYLIYNSSQMQMGADNPNMKMMKYMQYAFPVIFFFALNSWAAGLTCYMLFSNLLNIGQTFLVKNVLIDKVKLAAQMEEIRKNPKPKKGFMAKYEEAMKQQQELKKQQQQNKKK